MGTIEYRGETVKDSRVFVWRFAELERAGYSTQDAFVLAGAKDVDLHLALRLVAEGCPPKTAARILV